ncbi:hypothetical protein pb186bvf_006644 [Paramecium bursaria]
MEETKQIKQRQWPNVKNINKTITKYLEKLPYFEQVWDTPHTLKVERNSILVTKFTQILKLIKDDCHSNQIIQNQLPNLNFFTVMNCCSSSHYIQHQAKALDLYYMHPNIQNFMYKQISELSPALALRIIQMYISHSQGQLQELSIILPNYKSKVTSEYNFGVQQKQLSTKLMNLESFRLSISNHECTMKDEKEIIFFLESLKYASKLTQIKFNIKECKFHQTTLNFILDLCLYSFFTLDKCQIHLQEVVFSKELQFTNFQSEIKQLILKFHKCQFGDGSIKLICNIIRNMKLLENLKIDIDGSPLLGEEQEELFSSYQQSVQTLELLIPNQIFRQFASNGEKRKLVNLTFDIHNSMHLCQKKQIYSSFLLNKQVDRLEIDLSGILLTPDDVITLAYNICDTNCISLLLNLSNIRVDERCLVEFASIIIKTQRLLSVNINLQLNVIANSTQTLIISQFMEKKLVHLNIWFDSMGQYKLVQYYFQHNSLLVTSNLINNKFFKQFLQSKYRMIRIINRLKKLNLPINEFMIYF